MSDQDATKHLLLEVPDFGRDAFGRPLTSYLRLGQAPRADDSAADSGPDHDAVAAVNAHGSGHDLARLVTSFRNDERNLCDPPELDGTAVAPTAVAAKPSDAESLRQQWEYQRHYTQSLREALDAVIADPAAWLADLMKRYGQAMADVEARRDALASAEKDAAVSPAPSGQVPPGYSAPGYQQEQPEAPFSSYRSKAERQLQSAPLHTLGGWRDHTDGNRISTTRGDKVEVVNGNYRMIVLGRHDQPCDADGNPVLPGWDISGGHIDETTVTEVTTQSSLSWRRRWNGNWYSIEEKRKGDTRTVSVGDTDDSHHGHWRINTTGSDNPDSWHTPEDCPGGACRTNPKILDETWAEEVRSSLGTPDAPIPLMLDETHARLITSETRVGSMKDEQIMGNMETTMNCGSMQDTKTCAAMLTTTDVGRMTDTTNCTLMTSINLSGVRTNLTLGASQSSNWGMVNDIFIGARANLNIAATLDISASANFSLTIGTQNSLTLGAVLDASYPDGKEFGTAVKTENNVGSICQFALVHKISGLRIEVG